MGIATAVAVEDDWRFTCGKMRESLLAVAEIEKIVMASRMERGEKAPFWIFSGLEKVLMVVRSSIDFDGTILFLMSEYWK